MNSDVKPVSAKIYQFPPRPVKSPPKAPAAVARIIYGNCWYHDDAIQTEATSEMPPDKSGR